MTSVNKYPSAPPRSVQNLNFGEHRQHGRPAPAVQSRAPVMTSGWTTGDARTYGATSHYDAPARTIIDILFDPFRWAVSTSAHKVATTAVVCICVATLIF